jgi:aconitate decarboxylase
MGALHAPLDAVFELAAKRALKADEIAHIDIHMSHAAYHHGWWELERPITPIGAQMNVAYATAVAILDGAAMVQQFSPRRIEQDDVWALIPRITAHHDPAYDKAPGTRGATRMTIRFTDGQELVTTIPVSKTMSAPLDRARAIAKFRGLTDGLVSPERQDRILDAVLGLEGLADVATLIAPLAPPVGAAFA